MTVIINTQKEAEKLIKNGVLRVNEDLIINCDIEINASIFADNINAMNIDAININAMNIDAENIYAENIYAEDIKAKKIIYYASCIAYKNIECEIIKGRLKKSIHKALDGEIRIEHEHKFICECGEVQE